MNQMPNKPRSGESSSEPYIGQTAETRSEPYRVRQEAGHAAAGEPHVTRMAGDRTDRRAGTAAAHPTEPRDSARSAASPGGSQGEESGGGVGTVVRQAGAPAESTGASRSAAASANPRANSNKTNASARKDAVKIYVFAAMLIVFFVVGLLFFLRPSVSETEKRQLTEFPKFTWESFLSGEYFAQISTWYSDTFPGRETFISLNQALKNLYGIRTMQIVQNPPSGNNNPDDPGGNDPLNPGNEDDDTPVERFDTVFIKGDRAFEIYKFSQTASDRYASIINSAADKMNGVDVYNIIVPLSYSVNLTEREQQSIGASNVEDAISYMYGKMSDRVHTVEVLSGLLEHKDEYLYFRTDHHWTARGAYYAYEAFCRASGQEPLPLDSWQRVEFSGFLGTLYASAGQPPALAQNPDYVEAWIPNSTNKMITLYNGGSGSNYHETEEFPIIQTNPNYYQAAGSKYNTFIAGDHPLITIKNPNPSSTNGKSIVVVKESYGNAFVPFLVDQYETVYVVDYRYFQKAVDKTLPEFVSEVGADQVLFLNYIYSTAENARLNELQALVG